MTFDEVNEKYAAALKGVAAECGQPIAILLTEKDKENIGNMHEDAYCYAQFYEQDNMSVEERYTWMKQGREVSPKDISGGDSTNVDPNIEQE